MNYSGSLTNTSSINANTAIKRSEDDRYTLDRWKLYLDSCAIYHSFFAKEFLRNIKMVTRLSPADVIPAPP